MAMDGAGSDPEAIAALWVQGFKSIGREQTIAVRPLTILAGANSSGKSSMLQPLLLLKQTLEAPYDPGPLLINGPNVRFTSTQQFLSRSRSAARVTVGIETTSQRSIGLEFEKTGRTDLSITEMTFSGRISARLRPEMTGEQIADLLRRAAEPASGGFRKMIDDIWLNLAGSGLMSVVRRRCFLELGYSAPETDAITIASGLVPTPEIERLILRSVHVPALRANAERTYPVSAAGMEFPGTFDRYVAGLIVAWESSAGRGHLRELDQDLRRLGLTWRVAARRVSDIDVEIRVASSPRKPGHGKAEFVNIADVGVGVSQILPVLVALRAAEPGQLVYLEEPEIHLHPRAQSALAEIVAEAARRGVRVIVETHSSLLLLGVQSLVAEGKLDPARVKLHWFRRANGQTDITSADLDESGRFGNWPEDFADTALEAESRFLNAVGKQKPTRKSA